jgi:hypothetical protein
MSKKFQMLEHFTFCILYYQCSTGKVYASILKSETLHISSISYKVTSICLFPFAFVILWALRDKKVEIILLFQIGTI